MSVFRFIFAVWGLLFGIPLLCYIILAVKEYLSLHQGQASYDIDQDPIINFQTEAQFSLTKVQVEDLVFSVIVATPTEEPVDTIVFLHGFPDNIHSFSQQMRHFVSRGYKVFSPELPGYDPSTLSVTNDYRLGTVATQFLDILESLNLGKVHAIGHDWGAFVVSLASRLKSHQFRSIGLLAVPNFEQFFRLAFTKVPSQLVKSWYMLAFQIPYIPEIIFEGISGDMAMLIDLLKKAYIEYNPERLDSMISNLQRPGVLSASLGYYRSLFNFMDTIGLMFGFASERIEQYHRALKEPIAVPTLAIAGTKDVTVEKELFQYSLNDDNYLAGFQLEYVDCGHFVQHEESLKVSLLIEDFISTH